MIPRHLRISGFLSYRDPVELDFNLFDLACISGHNGAGKSSLLDAITWSLFGEARGKSADVINLSQDVKAAEVALTFEYEGNTFRVIRTLPRGKSTVLEFQVLNGDVWRSLTEKSTRETQARIEQTLRLDYETFINASFFLQGKADQFTQQKAGERKAILGTILGLEIWDTYKERTASKRKLLETDVLEIDGRVAEIDIELGEEDARRSRLAELEDTLKQLSSARSVQESAVEHIRKNAALLSEKRKFAETLSASVERSRLALTALESRLAEKESNRSIYAGLVDRAREIESTYEAWQKAHTKLEELNQMEIKFREEDDKRQPLLRGIEVEQARLEQELGELGKQSTSIRDQGSVQDGLTIRIAEAQRSLQEVESRINERGELERQRNEAREKFAALKVENDLLYRDIDEIQKRMASLREAHDATCPVCGQELSEAHRESTLKDLQSERKQKADLYRSNQTQWNDLKQKIAEYELRITQLANAEKELLAHSNTISQLTERIETLQSAAREWETIGQKRLAEVTELLEKGSFAVEARRALAGLDGELTKLGYDISAHDALRREESALRDIQEDHHNLDKARDVLRQIQSEIANLEEDRDRTKEEIAGQEEAYRQAAQALAGSESISTDLNRAERDLNELRENENLTRDKAGAARQRVEILSKQQARKKDYSAQREELNQQIMHHRTLERAFGRDGVPALLIEQALPQIENKANDLLERLSDGQMSVRFVTQSEYKDKKRDDLKETLDIQISDSAGLRSYEMYSGGEAFRVNFAIRLALSEILAQRKGARLQTLVIDEGFGSQDAQGRQRLIEAINLVKHDFAKILVITHLDELKDAFPSRIEVEKTERGSTVKVFNV